MRILWSDWLTVAYIMCMYVDRSLNWFVSVADDCKWTTLERRDTRVIEQELFFKEQELLFIEQEVFFIEQELFFMEQELFFMEQELFFIEQELFFMEQELFFLEQEQNCSS